MAKTLDQVGIETGNTVEAYHVTQSIDAFTGVEAYDISLSGSFNTTGSLNVTGSVIITGSVAVNGLSDTSQTNVLTIDTTTGQLFYTASTAVNPIDTGSFVTTASVNLNTITFTQGDGSTFPITVDTGSGGGGGGITPAETGSFYVSSSVNLNTITFTQGDGTTESITVDTGSSSGGYVVITDTDPGTGVTSVAPTYNTIKVVTIPANTFTTGDIVRIYTIYSYPAVITQAGAAKAYLSTSAVDHTSGGIKQIYGETDADWVNMQASSWGMSIVRNLHISASNQTTWLAAQDTNTINNDETYNSLSSVGPTAGYVTGNVDWTVNQYVHFRAAFQSSSGGTLNIKFVKITN